MGALTLPPVVRQRPGCCSSHEEELPTSLLTNHSICSAAPTCPPLPSFHLPPKHCCSSTSPRTVSFLNDTQTPQHTAGVTQQKLPSCGFKNSKQLFEKRKIKGKMIKSFSQIYCLLGETLAPSNLHQSMVKATPLPGSCQPPPEHHLAEKATAHETGLSTNLLHKHACPSLWKSSSTLLSLYSPREL